MLELLFLKHPTVKASSKKDIHNYKRILEATNVHRKKFSSEGEFRTHKSKKFSEIIEPLFTVFTGSGLLPQFKISRKNTSVDYTYWDDPNELVDRLRLLLAERAAGNNSHTNEIHSIIEELREAKIIN